MPFVSVSEFALVTYRRPTLTKLEIYTLDNSISILARHDQSVPPPLRNLTASYVAHDFTRPARRTASSLDPLVIHQVNFSIICAAT